ncbi:MAG: ATP-dependent acyl-CoA ligase [Promethearchaeota archaeon]|nr:MAG: ATP-dependent acyl-CoA ligase [Candidatus Lokiarchaeota archaeon]
MSTKRFRLSRKAVLKDVIKHKAETVGDKVFLTYIRDFDKGIDEKYTYKEMHLKSNRLANGLMNLGIKKGDGIALMEINSPEFLLTIFATFKMGAYTVLVNIALRGDGLKYIIDHSNASAIIIHWTLIDAFLEIKSQIPAIKHVIVDISEAPADFKLPEGSISFQEVMQAPDDEINIELSHDDLSLLMYTAGTTGLPKAIMFWQGKLIGGMNVQTLVSIAKLFGSGPDDILYTSLPLFHANALFLTTLPAFFEQKPLILAKRFSASRHWDICREYGITFFNSLGAMIPILMKQPERSNDKEHNVRNVYSAACPKELWVAFEKRFGIKIIEFYAASDGGGFMLTTQGQEDIPVGSMGKPPVGMGADIMDDDGNILEPEEVGELVFLVRESEINQRKVKYYKDDKASENLIREGKDGQNWFHTGDLAYKDKEGWFYFVDRKKDSIRRRGENIASYSIEKIINLNDKILEAAAYGIKSELGEDEIMVAIVLKPGETMTPEGLLNFCQGKMANFMIPRYIDFVDMLPKNEVHRILKRILKERGVTESTYDREKAGYVLK